MEEAKRSYRMVSRIGLGGSHLRHTEKKTEKTHTSLLHTPSHITGRDSVHKEDVEGISTIGGGVLPKCSTFGSGLGRELRKTGKAYKGEGRDRIPNVAGFPPYS